MACAGLLAAGSAQGLAVHADDAAFSGGIDVNGNITDTTTLISFTTTQGTVTNLQGSSSVVSVTGGTDLNRNIWGQAGSEIDGPASIVGLDVSTGAVNVNVANYFFGQVVTGTAGLGNDIFIVDISSEDTITVRPIDAAGNLIGNFTLSLGTAEFEPLPLATANLDGTLNQTATSPLDSGSNLNNLFVSIVAFDLSDFVGTGTLSGVAGIQIDGGGSFDPSVVGFTSVPEPGLALLLGAGLGVFALARRRS